MTDSLPSDQFAVGDVAVVVHTSTFYARYLDTECTVVDLIPDVERCGKITYECHVRLCDGKVLAAKFSCLRKRRPPREDLQVVRWSECPWQPTQVNA